MRPGLSFDHIFPIRDPASAHLARAKADCLLQAAVIDPEDRRRIYGRTAGLLELASLEPRSTPAGRLGRHDAERAGLNASA